MVAEIYDGLNYMLKNRDEEYRKRGIINEEKLSIWLLKFRFWPVSFVKLPHVSTSTAEVIFSRDIRLLFCQCGVSASVMEAERQEVLRN